MSETPAHYRLTVAGHDIEVDDITAGLAQKMIDMETNGEEVPLSIAEIPAYFAAIEYVARAPFKGQFNSDIRKAISRLEKLEGTKPCGFLEK